MKDKLLVLDDQVEILEILNENLKEEYEVHMAKNLSEAREILKTTKVQAILSDIDLGAENGLDLLREVAVNHPLVPVALFTGSHSRQYIIQAIKLGAVEFLEKPLDFEKVIKTTRKLVELNRRRVVKEEIILEAVPENKKKFLSQLKKMELLFRISEV